MKIRPKQKIVRDGKQGPGKPADFRPKDRPWWSLSFTAETKAVIERHRAELGKSRSDFVEACVILAGRGMTPRRYQSAQRP